MSNVKRPSIRIAMGVLLATVIMVLAVALPAFAEDYQYTVRVFPGNRGTLSADPVTVTVPKGGSVDLYSIATATVTDKKYVQTGFRLSGTDTLLGNGVINGIAEDMDYVVAYGVEANTVSYTLKFVERNTGKELAKSKTFYGKVGDKPVAAYEYIEGYRPLYLNITGTLKADENNVWTFEYVPLAEGETIVTTTTNTTTTYVNTPGDDQGGTTTTTTTTTGATEGGTDTNTTGDNENDDDEDDEGDGDAAVAGDRDTAGGPEGAAANQEGEGDEEGEPETQEILDLDTPLAGPDSGSTSSSAAEKGSILISNPIAIAGIAIAMVACLGIYFFFVSRKKKEEQNE